MICQHFLNGNCRFGDRCRNLHTAPQTGASPFQPVQQPVQQPQFQNRPPRVPQQQKECENFKRTGYCQFGASCRFSHAIAGGQFPGSVQPFAVQPSYQGVFPQNQPGFVPNNSSRGPQGKRNQPTGPQSNIQPFGAVQPPASFPGHHAQPNPTAPSSQFNFPPAPQNQIPGFGLPQNLPGPFPGAQQNNPSVPGPLSNFPGTFPNQPFHPNVTLAIPPGGTSRTPAGSTAECKQFKLGKCKYGASCRFSHNIQTGVFPGPGGIGGFPPSVNDNFASQHSMDIQQPMGLHGSVSNIPTFQSTFPTSAEQFPRAPVAHTPFPGLQIANQPTKPDVFAPSQGVFQSLPHPGQQSRQPTVICRAWKSTGYCKFGDRCRYLHSLPSESAGVPKAAVANPSFGEVDLGFNSEDYIEAEPEMLVETAAVNPLFPTDSQVTSSPQKPAVTRPVRETATKADFKGSDLEARLGKGEILLGSLSQEEELAAFNAEVFELGCVPENIAVLYPA